MREEVTQIPQAQVVATRATHCKGTITEGRFKGRRCGNAMPCKVHLVPRIRIRESSVLR